MTRSGVRQHISYCNLAYSFYDVTVLPVIGVEKPIRENLSMIHGNYFAELTTCSHNCAKRQHHRLPHCVNRCSIDHASLGVIWKTNRASWRRLEPECGARHSFAHCSIVLLVRVDSTDPRNRQCQCHTKVFAIYFFQAADASIHKENVVAVFFIIDVTGCFVGSLGAFYVSYSNGIFTHRRHS